jgi:hypothetical protein
MFESGPEHNGIISYVATTVRRGKSLGQEGIDEAVEILPLLWAKCARFLYEFPVSPRNQNPILHKIKEWHGPCSSVDRTVLDRTNAGRRSC